MEDVARFVVLLNTHPPFAARRAILEERIRNLKLEKGKIEFKKDLLSEVRQESVNKPAPQSIVFRPKFETHTVTAEMPGMSPQKQDQKMPPDRKRFGGWF